MDEVSPKSVNCCPVFSGLALHDLPRDHYSVSISPSLLSGIFFRCSLILLTFLSFYLQINMTTTLGTLNVAAEVDGVKIKGDGEMHMTLSSSLLPNLNRQLQFVTYTNTLFHPSTADTGEASSKRPYMFAWWDFWNFFSCFLKKIWETLQEKFTRLVKVPNPFSQHVHALHAL